MRVTIEKEIEIELTPTFFGGMTQEEYLAEFSKGLWPVDSIDDVIKYAARVAAYNGDGTYDGLGLLERAHSRHSWAPDVKFRVLSDESEEEIIKDEEK